MQAASQIQQEHEGANLRPLRCASKCEADERGFGCRLVRVAHWKHSFGMSQREAAQREAAKPRRRAARSRAKRGDGQRAIEVYKSFVAYETPGARF